MAVVETFTLRPAQPLTVDVEIRRPFAFIPKQPRERLELTLPLRNGLAGRVPLGEQPVAAEYRLGHFLTQGEATHLALPVIQLGGVGGGSGRPLLADPTFSSLWEVSRNADSVAGVLRYRYAGSRVPLAGEETRQFGFWLTPAEDAAKAFPAAIDAFYEHMLADVPPGPKWLHEIAMVGYDYLSDDGKGWDRDVQPLAEWLNPHERRRVALCLHGWYDAIGSYCYDAQSRRLRDAWVAFGPTRKIALTTAEMKRRMRLARELGFRVLLYFGDGLASDSGAPGYRDAWVYRDAQGNADPRLARPGYVWTDLLAQPRASRSLGLVPRLPGGAAGNLRRGGRRFRVGRDLRVQDRPDRRAAGTGVLRSGHAGAGQGARRPASTPSIRRRSSWRRIARACSATFPATRWWPTGPTRIPRATPAPGRGACSPTGGTCCGAAIGPAISGLDNTRYGVETFGVPVAISNGWGDDRGPAEWTAGEREQILELFRRRLQQPERVRYLTTDPLAAMQGDPLPAADAGTGELGARPRAAAGRRPRRRTRPATRRPARSTACATSRAGAAGTAGPARPSRARIGCRSRFPSRAGSNASSSSPTITTTASTRPSVWGVRDYEIQVRDGRTDAWKTVVTESQGRAVKVRVHDLPQPIEVRAFRIARSPRHPARRPRPPAATGSLGPRRPVTRSGLGQSGPSSNHPAPPHNRPHP